MQNFFAKAISLLFHPLLFPTYATLVIITANPFLFGGFDFKNKVVWVGLVFALTFIFPAVWLIMMRKLEMIDSLELKTSKERIIPFMATGTFYLWAYRMFRPSVGNAFFANELISHMLLGASIAIFIAFLANLFTKVSLHAIGAGCFFALSLILVRHSDFNLTLLVVSSIVIGGVIGTARLMLGAHRPAEIFSGYLVGIVGMIIAFVIVPKIFG